MLIIFFMEVIYLKDFSYIKQGISDLGLVLGFFDGVHIGHMQLINYARQNTKKGSLGVFTFDKPLKSIEGCLMNNDDKIEAMRKLDVDYLFIVECDDNFKQMSYVKFVDTVLKAFNPAKIFCGPDFRFGYEAKGDVKYLKQRFSQVYVLSYVNDHCENKISSSRIKELIKEGNVKEATRYLGKPYKIFGGVVHGLDNGHLIGYPTANILPSTNYVIPENGVYFTRTKINDEVYNSVTNIGTHPTIEKLNKPTIETYIIGYDGNIYGENISLFFYKKEREEVKFNNIDELKKKIAEDIENCENFFKYNY